VSRDDDIRHSHNRLHRDTTSADLGGRRKVDASWLADAEFYFLIGKNGSGVAGASLSFTMDKLTIPTAQVTPSLHRHQPRRHPDEFDR